eukprot:1158437-Pelagomonas_calceolata.AAC.10
MRRPTYTHTYIETLVQEPDVCPVYAQIDKARKELGYHPQSYDLTAIGAWYKEHGYGPAAESEQQRSRLHLLQWLLLCFVVMSVAVAVATFGLPVA